MRTFDPKYGRLVVFSVVWTFLVVFSCSLDWRKKIQNPISSPTVTTVTIHHSPLTTTITATTVTTATTLPPLSPLSSTESSLSSLSSRHYSSVVSWCGGVTMSETVIEGGFSLASCCTTSRSFFFACSHSSQRNLNWRCRSPAIQCGRRFAMFSMLRFLVPFFVEFLSILLHLQIDCVHVECQMLLTAILRSL